LEQKIIIEYPDNRANPHGESRIEFTCTGVRWTFSGKLAQALTAWKETDMLDKELEILENRANAINATEEERKAYNTAKYQQVKDWLKKNGDQ